MQETLLLQLGLILILGILAQWLGWRIKMPAILFLLLFGFIFGPLTNIIQPDRLFGDLLQPLVSLFVAIILFEGGLNLNIQDIKKERKIGRVIQRLITIGALLTWVGTGAFAYFVMRMDIRMAVLLGSILIVSGPTVVVPILQTVKPTNRVRSILQWEGILIDPIGAALSVLVLSAISSGTAHELTFMSILVGIGLTLLIGSIIGILGTINILVLLRRERIPEYLHSTFTLMTVVIIFLIANMLRAEAGLMAVTIMGIILANQKKVNIRKIATFKEELGILILSVLFIILSARIQLADFQGILLGAVLLVLFLVLILRPLVVMLCTIGAGLSRQERIFTASMAPRGIVAASVASIAALELSQQGYSGMEHLVAFTFLVVVGTVTIYALAARPLARVLGLVQTNPQGTLIVGAHPWARQIAHAIKGAGFDVWLVDTNYDNIKEAELENLPAVHGNILSDTVYNQLPIARIGRMLALTSNNELNTLSMVQAQEWVGKENTYTLLYNIDGVPENKASLIRKKFLFNKTLGYQELEQHFRAGASIELVPYDEENETITAPRKGSPTRIPLFLVKDQQLHMITLDNKIQPRAGDRLLVLSLK